MAQVDFSNAVLDAENGSHNLTLADNLLFNYSALVIVNAQGTTITSNLQRQTLTNTPSKVSILFSGTIGGISGNEFYIREAFNPTSPFWKVSNISFSSNDTFSFIIDIETSGNT